MEIPVNAQVECVDGVIGQSEYIIINPVDEKVTHLVVKANIVPNTEYLVPIKYVNETISDKIRLGCSKIEFEKMDPFVVTKYIGEKVINRNLEYVGGMMGMGAYYYLPYVTPITTTKVPVNEFQVPHGELAINRGTRVEATDGHIGKVDEFVVNPKSDIITHLVMREGHLWGKKEVIIPLSAIKETKNDTVFLKIEKKEVESLPIFTLQRHWE